MTEHGFDEDAADLVFENAAQHPGVLEAVENLGIDDDDVPMIDDPIDGPVTLTAGFRRIKGASDFEIVKKAWVRELTGADEERIARAKMKNDADAFIDSILESGVERLGDSAPTKDDLDSLVLGDRDFLLMEIARVTYGDEVELNERRCPFCNEVFDVTLSLADDVPVRRLDSYDDVEFDIPLRGDRVARAHLTTAEVLGDLQGAESGAEANTALIAASVEEIRGPKGPKRIEGDKEAAKSLGLKDRDTLIKALSEHMPGPQYNEVRFKHEPGCGEEIRLTVGLAELFPSL